MGSDGIDRCGGTDSGGVDRQKGSGSDGVDMHKCVGSDGIDRYGCTDSGGVIAQARGAATRLARPVSRSSLLRPSSSLSGDSAMRWRSTGRTAFLMSSGVT